MLKVKARRATQNLVEWIVCRPPALDAGQHGPVAYATGNDCVGLRPRREFWRSPRLRRSSVQPTTRATRSSSGFRQKSCDAVDVDFPGDLGEALGIQANPTTPSTWRLTYPNNSMIGLPVVI